MFNIYYGRGNINREKFIYSQIMKDGWSYEHPALVIVPDQFTVEAEKLAFMYTGKKALIGLDIYGFSRLEHNIVKECGGGDRVFIDKYGSEMLISKVAGELKDDLQVFGNSVGKPEFIKMMSDFISEMKLYSASPKTVSELINDMTADGSEDALSRKLEDVLLIYTHYAEELKGKYTDAEDFTDLCVSEMGRSRIVKGADVWIYGFDSFPPKYIDFIRALAAAARNVNVVLTYDRNCADEDLFVPTGKALVKLKETAEEAGAKVGRVTAIREIMPEAVEKKAAALEFMEHELYSVAPSVMAKPTDGNGSIESGGRNGGVEGSSVADDNGSDCISGRDGGITLVDAANINNEVESAAAFILSLVRDKGYRYRDIVVIAGDIANMGPVIRRTFDEYGLPVFFDEKRSILNSNASVLVISLLTAVSRHYRSEDIFKALKTGMLGVDRGDAEKLENYVIKYRITGSSWKSPFAKGTFEYEKPELDAINETRECVVSILDELKKITDKKQSTREFLVDFYCFATERLEIDERLREEAERQAEAGMVDMAQESVQIWGLITRLMDQIAELIGEEPFNLQKFIDILTTGLTGTDVGVIPNTPDDLMIGTPDRTMAGRVKATVILGANDGIIPPPRSDGGILTSEEIERISGLDYNICADGRERASEADLDIYRDFVMASDILWIGYCDSDSDGRAASPSELVRTIRGIFPWLKVEQDILSTGDSMDMVGGRMSTMRHYTHELNYEKRAGGKMNRVWNAVGGWFERSAEEARDDGADELYALGEPAEGIEGSIEEPAGTVKVDPVSDSAGLTAEMREAIMEGEKFTNDPDDLGPELSDIFFNKRGNIIKSMSPSQLESYTKCPFMHFITFGLRPEERRVYQASSREIGDVCHESIMHMTDELTAKQLWDKVDDDDLKKMVSETLKSESEDYRDGLFSYTNDEKYRSTRLEKLLFGVMKALVAQAGAGKIKKSRYELAFGRGKDDSGIIKPVKIDGGNGEKITLTGKIDRVDILENDTVKIIDYKTGSPDVKPSLVRAGYALQLMAYLEAACGEGRRPAGIFYFYIKEPDATSAAKGGAATPEKIAETIRKSYKMKGLFSNDPETIADIAGDVSTAGSDVISVKATKDGQIKEAGLGRGESRLLNDEEFDDLRKSAREAANEIAEAITRGKIKLTPAVINKRATCSYCNYRNICRFDERFDGCTYNVIK